MPSPPRSVLDGLEGVWDAAAARWRTANTAREEAEAEQARAEREGSLAIGRSMRRGVRAASAKADEAKKRAASVVDAMFGVRPSSSGPQTGPINYREIDARRAQTEADIRGGFEGASMAGRPEAMAGAWPYAATRWVRRVWPGGEWDNKARAREEGYKPHERQGNFAYGATAQALGLPLDVALAGAGGAQRLVNVGQAIAGERLNASEGRFRPPYGDDPRDQESIRGGYAYGRGRSRR